MPVQYDKTLPISYADAAELILNIGDNKGAIPNHPVLNMNAGGTFRTIDIENWVFDDQVKGLMFWYCLDGDDFFLALEPWVVEYEESDIQNRRPNGDVFLKPKKLIKENLYDRANLRDELPVFRDSVAQRQRKVDKKVVMGWVDNYAQFMKDNYNQNFSPYSFFVGLENGVNYLRSFFEKKQPRNLRYFFSYEADEFPYSLRVILVPVNRLGNNIRSRASKVVIADDALQYSWPPKPQTNS